MGRGSSGEGRPRVGVEMVEKVSGRSRLRPLWESPGDPGRPGSHRRSTPHRDVVPVTSQTSSGSTAETRNRGNLVVGLHRTPVSPYVYDGRNTLPDTLGPRVRSDDQQGWRDRVVVTVRLSVETKVRSGDRSCGISSPPVTPTPVWSSPHRHRPYNRKYLFNVTRLKGSDILGASL